MNRVKLSLFLLALVQLSCTVSSAQISAPIQKSPRTDKKQVQEATLSTKLDVRTVAAESLNVRSCPQADDHICPPVLWLHYGDKITILREAGDWCKIGQGWIECKDWTKP